MMTNQSIYAYIANTGFYSRNIGHFISCRIILTTNGANLTMSCISTSSSLTNCRLYYLASFNACFPSEKRYRTGSSLHRFLLGIRENEGKEGSSLGLGGGGLDVVWPGDGEVELSINERREGTYTKTCRNEILVHGVIDMEQV